MAYPVPDQETARLEELQAYDILDTPPERIYDDLCHLASHICDTEIAAITLIDEDRQWLKASQGMQRRQTDREDAFCAHAIVEPDEVMVVEDALADDRFRENPYVQGDPNIRFYAGAPLRTPSGHGLGTICAIDDKPQELTETQERSLQALSRMVMTQLELRRRSRELREAKKELERSNEELDRFASVVSHELKGPLSEVVSSLDLLQLTEGEELSEEASEYLEHAIRGGDRMNELIKDTLRYSRASRGDSERQRVDMDRVMEQVVSDLSGRIERQDARLEIDPLPEVHGDPSLIRQVLDNLVSNALKYGGDPPVNVRVTVEDACDRWRFSVTDDGNGIPEEDREDLFGVFCRASNTGDREGTGVGLALCERIVERHGGQVGVDSTLGDGSTFWFTLPKPPAAGSPADGDERRGP